MNLKTLVRVLCVVCLLAPTVTLASMPEAWVQVGNGPREYFTDWVQAPGGLWNLNFTTDGTDYQVSGNASALGDPWLAYGVSFTNFSGAPLLFQFGLSETFAPFSPPEIVYASYSGSGTDVAGDGYSITPYYADMDGDGIAELQVSDLNGTNMGVDVGQAYVDGPGFPGHSNNLGVYSSGPMAGPGPGPWTTLNMALGFYLGGGSDVATLNGYTAALPQTPPPVPEPASVLLLGAGLIGAAMVETIRRKRA